MRQSHCHQQHVLTHNLLCCLQFKVLSMDHHTKKLCNYCISNNAKWQLRTLKIPWDSKEFIIQLSNQATFNRQWSSYYHVSTITHFIKHIPLSQCIQYLFKLVACFIKLATCWLRVEILAIEIWLIRMQPLISQQ